MKIGNRTIPDDCAAPAAKGAAKMSQSYTIKLVTPMFGGGAEAGLPDKQMPFRASSIRGHLRFWWRTLRGPFLENPMNLPHHELVRLRETELFGSAEVPSPIDLSISEFKSVKVLPYGTETKPFGLNAATKNSAADPRLYALFPALPNQQNPAKDLTAANASFTLQVTWPGTVLWQMRVRSMKKERDDENRQRSRRKETELPAVWDDMQTLISEFATALWGWANFGGIGARTRRGVGAIQLADANFSLLVNKDNLRYPMPSCMSLYLSKQATDDAGAGWSDAVKLYRDFRQLRKHGSAKQTLTRTSTGVEIKPITPPNGRSEWPEADSLRTSAFTGAALKEPNPKPAKWPEGYKVKSHDQPVDPSVTLPAFPRAILGMPIVFHFADCPSKATNYVGIADTDCDPKDVEILPVVDKRQKDRMASPVITRPIWDGKQWRAGFLFLKGLSELTNLEACARGPGIPSGEPRIATSQIAGPSLVKIKPLSDCKDAISALKKKLASSYTEIASPQGGDI